MAQLVLSAASAGANFVATNGAQFLARTAASTAASFVGAQLNRFIFGPQRYRSQRGGRLNDLQVQASSEGAPVFRVYGRARIAGQVIWATNFKETLVEETQSTGGKGGGSRAETTVSEYLYSCNFAVGLCEGPISRIGRVWADGKPLALGDYTVRIYNGDETQTPDALIEAVEGVGAAPGFRGLAYVVFEDMPLKRFGNRLPQLNFEVFRLVGADDPKALENAVSAVNIIPSSGEFVYGTEPVSRTLSEGATASENVNNAMGDTDFTVSMDEMQDILPNCQAASLIVSWFGDDLRAGETTIRPGVEETDKETTPYSWIVGGVDRAGAYEVTRIDDRPAYGGTPSDRAVIQAIQDLKARGLSVVFYPFILMDIPSGNGLPDPYGGAAQGAYPWRGRITCHPAPGQPGTPDKTAAAEAQIDALFGTAAPGDFTQSTDTVFYSGSSEWSIRRMVLHYAHLCARAGGVDAFLIGTEMVGTTTVRGAADAFPAVDHFKALAADVKSILGGATKVSYAADWTEYFGYQPSDGSGDVFFHLDPLWSDPNIDFIGIDNYMPLSDWRDGPAHLDAVAGWETIYDRAYLQSNLAGGEGYDWFYASAADRDAQVRTPISDGAYGEPWVFRYKDLWNWWSNAHHDRPGGVRSVAPTAWTPESKPIWMTEIGAGAVDKSANQPNVFVDPKSSEDGLPYYSNGERDDVIARRFLEAVYDYWATPANNPTSSVYGAPMVAADRIFAYAWDARAYPDFPARSDVWGDADNWERGHWLNGRAGLVPLGALVETLSEESGFSDTDGSALYPLLPGYVVEQPMSPRDAIEPLMQAFQFDVAESGGVIKFRGRGGAPAATVSEDALAAGREADFDITRAQETDLPGALQLGFLDAEGEYRVGVVEARVLAGTSARLGGVEVSAVIDDGLAQSMADSLLADAWVMRDTLAFRLPPSMSHLEPTDVVTFEAAGRAVEARLTVIEDRADRGVEAVCTEASVYAASRRAPRRTVAPSTPVYGTPLAVYLDLPLLRGDEVPYAPYIAAFASPWPGGVAVYKNAGGGDVLAGVAAAQATMGETTAVLPAGPVGRWDRGAGLQVRLYNGALQSKAEADVLGGDNVLALETAPGVWEVLQFAEATLDGGVWTLRNLLRGQAGSDIDMAASVPIGARIVVMTAAVRQLDFGLDERGLTLVWKAGPQNALTGDPSFGSQSLSFAGVGLRPLSPVHVRAERQGQDIVISWVRRTRIGGDSWEGAEVPLSEAFEAYEVDILDGGAVVRTLSVTASSAVYLFADQESDFGTGGPAGALDVQVFQRSDVFGRGAARAATLSF
ncbi:MAG: glycoside hydrolase/phage tail family protein [Pseudomonadota bacterium]